MLKQIMPILILVLGLTTLCHGQEPVEAGVKVGDVRFSDSKTNYGFDVWLAVRDKWEVIYWSKVGIVQDLDVKEYRELNHWAFLGKWAVKGQHYVYWKELAAARQQGRHWRVLSWHRASGSFYECENEPIDYDHPIFAKTREEAVNRLKRVISN